MCGDTESPQHEESSDDASQYVVAESPGGPTTLEWPRRLEDLVHGAAQELLGNRHQRPRLLRLHYIVMNGGRTQAQPRVNREAANVRCLLCHEKPLSSLVWTGATGALSKSPASSSCFPQVAGVKVTPLGMCSMANGGKSESRTSTTLISGRGQGRSSTNAAMRCWSWRGSGRGPSVAPTWGLVVEGVCPRATWWPPARSRGYPCSHVVWTLHDRAHPPPIGGPRGKSHWSMSTL